MRIALYSPAGEAARLGIVTERGCIDLAHLGVTQRSFTALWDAWDQVADRIRAGLQNIDESQVRDHVTWHAPVDSTATVWAAAANYAEHLAEGGFARPDYPPFFLRSLNSLVGHNGAVQKPWFSERFDYEGELAIIIGKSARYVSEADAADYIAGYACFNDGSVRDWQRHTTQITVGKNFVASGALGPWITTSDEVGDIDSRRLETAINGRTVQSSQVGKAIWGIKYVVSYLSAVTELKPGDVIALGTPGGVGARQVPELFLNDGDRVDISIEGIGTLSHGVTELTPPAQPWPVGVAAV